jgi:signal transduction histidine kinase
VQWLLFLTQELVMAAIVATLRRARIRASSARVATEVLLEREQVARKEAENANRLKDEFLATMSHELRTPLNAILGWATMIRKAPAPAVVERAAATIERNARAQARLVDDILDVSRIIRGRLRLRFESVNVESLLREAINAVTPAAESKGVRIEGSDARAAGEIVGDPDRLAQVAWNLLSNAVKFTPSGGRVEIGVQRDERTVCIQVCDTGEGIDPDFLPFVFDRFRQFDRSPAHHQGGLGLGLAIVRHLVELHGGSVFAASEGRGKGATFTVRLPLGAVVREPQEPSASRASGDSALPRERLRLSS